MTDTLEHTPVMVQEVLSAFNLREHVNTLRNAQGTNVPKIIDATLGAGGHTRHLLGAGASVLGIELDDAMREIAQAKLEGFQGEIGNACPPFKLVVGNYKNIASIAKSNGFGEVDGVLFDLGVASPQLTSKTRGFSFSDPSASLDMRKNAKTQGVTAADLLNSLRKEQLVTLFAVTLTKTSASKLAEEVLLRRESKPFETVNDLLAAIARAKLPAKGKTHKATLPFLALRIAVNSELADLPQALNEAYSLLKPFGRLVVISFHSSEDLVVVETARQMPNARQIHLLALTPRQAEVASNPRSRSARLRVIEKNA